MVAVIGRMLHIVCSVNVQLFGLEASFFVEWPIPLDECVWEARFQGEGVVAWWTVAERSSRLSCS